NDTSVAFFGVNVSCAQCHNHPLVADWTQDHFYGMKMFLARTFDNGGFLGERGYGTIKFKPTKGPERTAKMMFLTGAVVDDPVGKEPTAAEMQKEKAVLDRAKAAKAPPPAPKFSARAKLVEVALKDANADFLARNIVNRMWHHLLGVGLVTPLTPMQLATSLKIAATDPAAFEGKPDEAEKRLEQLEAGARGFASLIAQPADNFQIGVGEALLFSNGDRVMKEFLTDGPGTTLGRVKTMKDPQEAVGFLVKTAYGRPATAEESRAL